MSRWRFKLLTSQAIGLKYGQFPGFYLLPRRRPTGFMTPIPPSSTDTKICKHPRVQIVSRDEETEYVECMECGDIFESSEFKDMTIEETKLRPES
jgi:hypothetical protein